MIEFLIIIVSLAWIIGAAIVWPKAIREIRETRKVLRESEQRLQALRR